MSYLSTKAVSTILHLKSYSNFNLITKYCLSSHITLRKYSGYRNNSAKYSFNDRKLISVNNENIVHRNLLNIKPIYNSQQRHLSDYFDGRSFYKWLSESTPVEYTQNFIISIHDYTGLPWWSTIICTTFLLRSAITLPLAIYQALILAKVENIVLIDMPEIRKDVRKEVAVLAVKSNWDERRSKMVFKRMLKDKWNALIVEQNCHPFKGTITLWFQLPMWIFFTTSLRNIAYMLPHHDSTAQLQYLQMSVGGFLWMPNLTLPDETWLLPALLGVTNLAIIELQSLKRVGQAKNLQKYITNFFRCISLALIPISATVPSAVCIYWTTSSLIGLGQNLFLMSNRVRGFFNIPDTPTTMDHPYLQLLTDIRGKGRSIKDLFIKQKKSGVK